MQTQTCVTRVKVFFGDLSIRQHGVPGSTSSSWGLLSSGETQLGSFSLSVNKRLTGSQTKIIQSQSKQNKTRKKQLQCSPSSFTVATELRLLLEQKILTLRLTGDKHSVRLCGRAQFSAPLPVCALDDGKRGERLH